MQRTILRTTLLLLGGLTLLQPAPETRRKIDLAPFAQLLSWEGDLARELAGPSEAADSGASNLGIQWREERDIHEVKVRFSGNAVRGLSVEYWFRVWPYADPNRSERPGPFAAASIEDPVDDIYQGRWLPAATQEDCRGSECRYIFLPLRVEENPLAANLPGVVYRRTLKVRLVSGNPLPRVTAIQAFSDSLEKPVSIRIALGQNEKARVRWNGSVEVFNGWLKRVRPWRFAASDAFQDASRWQFTTQGSPKGLLVDLVAAEPQLAGSLDVTLVTVRAQAAGPQGELNRTFTFEVGDLKRGPIYIPDFCAYITNASDPENFRTPTGLGPRIRQLIPKEPEQTYERASREIPPLDPWMRQYGDKVYLPLAIDSSWQKFAVEYGGNVFISKRGAKVKGQELKRLQWNGDRITWRLGTGQKPYFREDRGARVSKLDGYLPVVIQEWSNEGLSYRQEAFATALSGPLSPRDPARNEQTPAILMIQMTVGNGGATEQTAHFWIATEPGEELKAEGRRLRASGGALRAVVDAPSPLAVEPLPGSEGKVMAGRLSFAVPPGASRSWVVKLPFVSDLTPAESLDLERLDYDTQRRTVVSYWRELVQETVRFAVPEEKFNLLARSVVPHIHITAAKDPGSGLYMVGAASYNYQVFANETAFQATLLDVLGDHKTAQEYFETLLALQGSRNYPGMHKGPYDAIFHGARVDEQYDYTASNYGLDHGTILWSLAEHYLYSRDRTWLQRAWPRMRKAIEWILAQRATTRLTRADGGKVPEYGLLPASHLEDNADWAHWFTINAFCWAGIRSSAEAMKDIGHADAAMLEREAAAYLEDLRLAIRRAWQAAPVTRMRDGTYSPYVPVEPYQRWRRFGPKRAGYYSRYGRTSEFSPTFRLSATREVLYGPVMYLNLGVFKPDEPAANWILDDWEDNLTLSSGLGISVHGIVDDAFWFSQGGMVFQANLQNPILAYLKRHEIPAAIRSLYNNFVSCFYPEVNIFTEEYRMWRHASGPFYKSPDEARFVHRLRDVLVREEGETLWLASGTPRRWLETPEGISVERLITHFGPVSYSLKPTGQPGVLEAGIELPSQRPAAKAYLVARVPKGRIRAVAVNGKPWTRIDAQREAIELPPGSSLVRIEYR